MTTRLYRAPHARSNLSSLAKKRYRAQIIFGFLSFSALLLLFEIYGRSHARLEPNSITPPQIDPNVAAGHVTIPQLLYERELNKHATLFMLPGRENKCHYQYDYICKFWFYIRCFVYGAFPKVKMLSLDEASINDFQQQAKDGDIALVIWRSKNHSIVPPLLDALLQWRNQAEETDDKIARVRIGVFHIANENNRTDWPWYTKPDFIIRNYWIPDMPKHVTYVPLGPQLPNACIPRATNEVDGMGDEKGSCSCKNLQFKLASKRKYTWNFSGSLRKKRKELLRRLRKSETMHDKGYVQVSKKFGGEGIFGSISDNPKNDYLASILESQFVFAPCGNAMETHRIYEAASMGAIPVVENCDTQVSGFFPLKELLIDGGPEEMIGFVEGLMNDVEKMDELQGMVMEWWHSHSVEFSRNVSQTIRRHVASVAKWNP